MAALVKAETGIDMEIIEGGRGEFTVWVGDELISKKDESGFPEDRDVLEAVRQALARG